MKKEGDKSYWSTPSTAFCSGWVVLVKEGEVSTKSSFFTKLSLITKFMPVRSPHGSSCPFAASGFLLRLLALLSTADASGGLACHIQDPVLVIGAGIAGLAAARELARLGFCSVKVVEARQRAGGRLWTDTSLGGIPVDMGAAWLHGISNNILYNLMNEPDTNLSTFPYSWEQGGIFDEKGNALSDAVVEQMYQDLELVQDKASKWANRQDNDPTLQQAVDGSKDKYQSKLYHPQYLDFMFQSEVVEEYAAELNELSGWWWDMGAEIEGGEAVPAGGYSTLIDYLVESLNGTGRVELLLGSEVVKIEQMPAGQVNVTVRSGTVYTAHKVIITLPLSILSSSGLFVPDLPANKHMALQHLRMGHFTKLVLRFNKIWWSDPNEKYYDQLIQIPTAHFTTLVYPYRWQGVKDSHVVVVATTTGSEAKAMDQLTPTQAKDLLMAAIRTAYPAAPDPVDWQQTNWTQDPFTLGSYSYAAPGCTPCDYLELGKRFGSLFFAGEHTNAEFMSTAHGAYESGLRAALEIGALYGVAEDPCYDCKSERIRVGCDPEWELWEIVLLSVGCSVLGLMLCACAYCYIRKRRTRMQQSMQKLHEERAEGVEAGETTSTS
eukprot:g29201.t1